MTTMTLGRLWGVTGAVVGRVCVSGAVTMVCVGTGWWAGAGSLQRPDAA